MNVRLVISLLAIFLLQGCSSILIKSTPAPVRYKLDYTPVVVDCPNRFGKGIKIYEMSASSPYDQPNMVVVEKGLKVKYSSSYQWISLPGTLIADSLLRDLNNGTLFAEAVASNDPHTPPLELTGHIFTFCWEKTGEGYRAHLNIEVSITDTTGNRGVILRKNYQIRSRPYRNDSADNFAQAMSASVREFSEKLQKDLCREAG